MPNLKLTAVVVVYNKRICESITCERIKSNALSMDVLIIDNSDDDTIRQLNKNYCKGNHYCYVSMGGNKGLSKAYNQAVEHCKDSDVIILLDDDTEVTKAYDINLREELEKHPEIDIFAPIIRGQDGVIYSPNEFSFLKNHFISSPNDEVSQEAFNAIASCLAIRMRVFEDYRFNEKLFLDQVDQFFFCEQRKLGRKFGILRVEITQHFYQRDSSLTASAGWKRLRQRIVDIFRHARLMGGGKYILLAFIKCCGLGVQIGKKSKSVGVMIKAAGLSCRCFFIDD